MTLNEARIEAIEMLRWMDKNPTWRRESTAIHKLLDTIEATLLALSSPASPHQETPHSR